METEPGPFELDGKTYTYYQATQAQRRMEREIRALKREESAYEAAGLKDKAKETTRKIRIKSIEYREFSENVGIRAKTERLRVCEPLKNATSRDIIKLPDTDIPRSVGAKALNYDIEDKATGTVYHYAEGTKIQNREVFAGYGTSVPLHDGVAEGLTRQYGGKAEQWQHVKGVGIIDDDGDNVRAEVHWFQEESVGQVKHKIKRWLE